MAEGWEPYGISTEAGKALFTQMNMEHGSSVWGPVGKGIVAVEREVQERIIALIETKDEWYYEFSDVSDVIALIRGENE